MTIDLSAIVNVEQWKEVRKQYPFMQPNAKFLHQFNEMLINLVDKYDGIVSYLSTDTKDKKFLTYTEGTPIFSLFKLVPQTYFIDTFEPSEYWKKSNIDDAIIDRLTSYNTFKYELNSTDNNYDPNYYLYVCTSHYEIDKIAMIRSAYWAKINNKRLVIRLGVGRHVFDKKNLYSKAIKILRDKGITEENVIIDTTSHIDTLVSNCLMMLTAASGVGFAALLKGKPVSYFLRDCDYSYGPIARFTSKPEEAFDDNYVLNYDDVRRYFTWYYNKIAIDLLHQNAGEMIEQRIYDYFTLNKNLDEMLT